MKNRRRSFLGHSIAALVAAMLAPGPALAEDLPRLPAEADGARVVQADCYAIGERIAAQNGGTLARALPGTRGGQQVCVIVVLVPGKDGGRPRREEFVVPAN